MICPRCSSELKYGLKECPNCSLRFKYKEEAPMEENVYHRATESKCSKKTACILSYLFGSLGLHNFYLGYYIVGTIRMIIFLVFCGAFVSPQVMSLLETGNFRITYDYFGIFGLVMLGIIAISFIISKVEFIKIMLGESAFDSKGLPLK